MNEYEGIEDRIMEMLDRPGWVSVRGCVNPSSSPPTEEELRRVETVMYAVAKQGRAALWRLIIQDGAEELLAVARPDLELDKELEQRSAWAKAVRITEL
ncbi:MAG: hypothetical protein V2B18_20635 [Pseudomonadota bacterium]